MTSPGKLFCSKPFTWFEISRGRVEGEVFLCCPSWLDTPIGNLGTQSVDEVWNGSTAQEIRRSILDGGFEYCSATRCPYLQTVSGPVQPLDAVTDPEMRAVIEGRLTVLPNGPRQVNCSYDRSCNLSCPTCRTEIIVESRDKSRVFDIERKLRAGGLADTRLLYITGSGDPFGSPFFRRWLQTMKLEEAPQLETIHLHTNGLLWSPKMWHTIPEEVRALVHFADISIDAATPATYRTNRRGGSFEVLLENLSFVSGLRRDGPLRWLGINMVVQDNNVDEMAAFVELGRRFGVDTVYFHQLVNWGTFTDTDFKARAVHLPDHPRHGRLLELLRDPIVADPIVYLGNLTSTRRGDPLAATEPGAA
ncbi:MAG: SPASM domain-containing protein [Gemmatimonadales bacterium]